MNQVNIWYVTSFSLRYIDTWAGICEVSTFSYTQSGIAPMGRSYDVFDESTILLVHTPGHSHGLFSVMLRGRERYIVLGNDGAYLPESFTEHKIPGFTVNNQLAAQTLDWLIQCKKDSIFSILPPIQRRPFFSSIC